MSTVLISAFSSGKWSRSISVQWFPQWGWTQIWHLGMLLQIPMWIMWGIQIDFPHFWDELKDVLKGSLQILTGIMCFGKWTQIWYLGMLLQILMRIMSMTQICHHWNAVADSNVDRVQDQNQNLLAFVQLHSSTTSHVMCACYIWTQ